MVWGGGLGGDPLRPAVSLFWVRSRLSEYGLYWSQRDWQLLPTR